MREVTNGAADNQGEDHGHDAQDVRGAGRRSGECMFVPVAVLAAALTGTHANAAENDTGFSISCSASGTTNTFTVTRTGTGGPVTVKYRTVGESAFPGQHFTAASGELTFDADHNERTVPITELTPSSNAYKYQTSSRRTYRLEVTDMGGFLLASKDRNVTSGLNQFNGAKVSSSVANLVTMTSSGNFSSGMSSSKYLDVSYTPPSGQVETSGTLNGYVLTFKGTIPNTFDATLITRSVSGTITDLAGNSLSGTSCYKSFSSIKVELPWGGDGGSEADPYTITRAEQLAYMAVRVNANNGSDSFNGKYFVLDADIAYTYSSDWDEFGDDDTSNNYTPIGCWGRSFQGNFNGRGHTISGIRVYKETSGASNDHTAESLGLFGFVSSGGTVTLTRDYNAMPEDGPLFISNDVTLDLNGHTLTGVDEQDVIRIEGGTLTLQDSAGGGRITHAEGATGRGVNIYGKDNPSTLIMEGGSICGNTTSITGNTTSYNSGGVVVDYSGTFTMSGGTISGDSCGSDKHGGGVAVYGTFRISGSPVISGNMASKSGSTGNVYLHSGMVITVTDALDESASVGVSMKTSGTFTSGLSGNGDASNFTSDDSDYRVYLTDSGEAALGRFYAVTVSDGGAFGTVTASSASALAGETITLTVTPDENCQLEELTVTFHADPEILLWENSVEADGNLCSGETFTVSSGGSVAVYFELPAFFGWEPTVSFETASVRTERTSMRNSATRSRWTSARGRTIMSAALP